MTVSLVLAGVGVYFAFSKLSQRFVQSAFGAGCSSRLAQPGAALSTGDSLCGGKLGSEELLADCTLGDSTPSGIQVWTKSYAPSEGPWLMTTATANSEGCNLAAGPEVLLTFSTKDEQPASAVVVADFKYLTSDNDIGLQVACGQAGCVDISLYPDGQYSLDEGRPDEAGWDRLSRGFALRSSFLTGESNRMILRLQGRHVSVFINGFRVTQADTKRLESSGFVEFYLDNSDGKTTETVRLQRLYVFEAA